MENLGTRVKALCKAKDGNMSTMEKALGLSNGYIHNLIVRGNKPSGERLIKMANYLGVTTDYLLNGSDNPNKSDGVLIPILGRVAAGIPISAVENVIGQEEISKQMASTGEYFALKIKGDSMSPYIMDGDIVVVRQQNTIETDEIAVVLINGSDGVCKKIKKTDDSIILISLNTAYDPMIFTKSEIDTIPVTILGKVVEIRRAVK